MQILCLISMVLLVGDTLSWMPFFFPRWPSTCIVMSSISMWEVIPQLICRKETCACMQAGMCIWAQACAYGPGMGMHASRQAW